MKAKSKKVKKSTLKKKQFLLSSQMARAYSPDVPVRRKLAGNAFLLVEVQKVLASDTDFDTRRFLAKNPVVCDEVLLSLLENSSEHIAKVIIFRSSCSEALQVYVAKNKNPFLQMCLATKKDICREALLTLSRVYSPGVLATLAKKHTDSFDVSFPADFLSLYAPGVLKKLLSGFPSSVSEVVFVLAFNFSNPLADLISLVKKMV